MKSAWVFIYAESLQGGVCRSIDCCRKDVGMREGGERDREEEDH